jgi:hypothetical protein
MGARSGAGKTLKPLKGFSLYQGNPEKSKKSGNP